MSCEHRFKPFPGSRAKLYCEHCGIGKDAFAPAARTAAEPRPRRRSSQQLSGGDAPQLPLDQPDPDREAAQAILDARKTLEERVRAIVSESTLKGDEAEQFVAEAMSFGEDLDLDRFASLVMAASDRGETRFAQAEPALDG